MLAAFLNQHKLQAYYLPKADRFQSEYLQASEERLHWLTGFTGSAGQLVTTPTKTILFTDSRYTIQAKQEVPADVEIHINKSPVEWLTEQHITQIGLDPWLATEQQQQQFTDNNITITHHTIDDLWQNRPLPVYGTIHIHPLKYAGQPWQEKVAALRQQQKTVLISDPASLCWLLNIRGHDLTYTPLVLGYCLVTQTTITVYCNHTIPKDVQQFFGNAVIWKSESSLLSDLPSHTTLDKTTCPVAISSKAQNAILTENPCLLSKSIKNSTEQQGTRDAHKRDGKALTSFLNHLIESQNNGKQWTELTAAKTLDRTRAQLDNYYSPSFPTIAGTGPNGAIVHYGVTEQSSQPLQDGQLFLVDSGGQFKDGTTDVTRTILVGNNATAHQKKCFTLVLKGHIALAQAVFPEGTIGAQLDVLARQYLWQAGLDYGHGTGHGVGSALSVHEGPQGISKRNHVLLQAGMILSNEPGYYEEGQFGVRIENLVLVQQHTTKGFLCFETLTLAPIDERLINEEMLTSNEQQWLAAYHEKVAANAA